MIHVACRINATLSCEVTYAKYAQETSWQLGVLSCNMPGMPTHFVQELNVSTVHVCPACLTGNGGENSEMVCRSAIITIDSRLKCQL